MTSRIKKITLLVAILFVENAACERQPGAYCIDDLDCSGGGLSCMRRVPGCSYGECSCANDFTFDELQGVCKRSAVLGMPCSSTVHCKDDNSVCIQGSCACTEGYVRRRSPDGLLWICSPQSATGAHGAKCADSRDCSSPFHCDIMTEKCACDIGYTYTGNQKRLCVPKGVGESCKQDDECLISNSFCKNGTCQCPAMGHQKISWLVHFRERVTNTFTGWKITACIGSEDAVRNSGSQCLSSLKRRRNMACDERNICIPCNPRHNTTGYCYEFTRQNW